MHFLDNFLCTSCTILPTLDVPQDLPGFKNTAATPTSQAGSDTKSKRRGSVRKSGVLYVQMLLRYVEVYQALLPLSLLTILKYYLSVIFLLITVLLLN